MLKPTVKEAYDIDGIGLNSPDGLSGGIFAEGFLLLSCLMICMQIKVLSMGTTANWILLAWWVISVGGFYLFNFVYSQIVELDWYGIVEFTMNLKVYWIAIFLTSIIILSIDYIVEEFFGNFFFNSYYISYNLSMKNNLI